jgi:hypothetical protein
VRVWLTLPLAVEDLPNGQTVDAASTPKFSARGYCAVSPLRVLVLTSDPNACARLEADMPDDPASVTSAAEPSGLSPPARGPGARRRNTSTPHRDLETSASIWAAGRTLLVVRRYRFGGHGGHGVRWGRRAGWKTSGADAVRIERIDPGRHNRQRCAATIPPDGWLRKDARGRPAGRCGRQLASDGGRVLCCYR